MKYFLLFTIAFFVVFAACKKRNNNDLHCWVCYRHDSVVQNFGPATMRTTVKPIINDTLCKQSDIQIQYYMDSHHNKVGDTLFKSKKGDSVAVEYFNTVECDVP